MIHGVTDESGSNNKQTRSTYMAQNVIAQQSGGSKRVLDSANTVADVKAQLGAGQVVATVNGDAVADTYALSDGDFVFLTPAVKGGLV
jgi:sulfur carrier protein ThiS